MLRVNGLFGWVRANDRRSLALFSGFLAAFHVGAVLSLVLPLAGLDPEHAPFFAWDGYAVRYVPAVTLAAFLLFALLMLWHVNAVRRRVAFAFVDESEEPRLCRIVEPLAIAMGLPAPYVGVIEAPALNAFACGIRRRDAVVVVTRGLLDALDDDELAAVVAHELAHIRNGDIRLIAAADVCLRMLGWLVTPRLRRRNRLQEIVGLPLVTIMMPPVLLVVLLVNVVAQAAARAGGLVRRMISTAREFVADAAAVEATQNPEALVSALRRIEGRSRVAGLSAGQDAMMIDGDAEGGLATHPSVDARIAAIVAVTGSMALIAPARRDTRPEALRVRADAVAPAGSGVRRQLGLRPIAYRESADDPRNRLGLTREMSWGAILAVVAFLAGNAADIARPAALLAKLDPRPFGSIVLVAGRGMACNLGTLAPFARGERFRELCGPGAMDALIAAHRDVPGPVGAMLRAMPDNIDGTFSVRSNPTR